MEAGISKAGVRLLATRLGLGELADLPAAPCLASRVETGIRIEAASLQFIHQVERLLQRDLNPPVVRCRIRREAVVVELDPWTLAHLSGEDRRRLSQVILALPEAEALIVPQGLIRYEAYRVGSAFLR